MLSITRKPKERVQIGDTLVTILKYSVKSVDVKIGSDVTRIEAGEAVSLKNNAFMIYRRKRRGHALLSFSAPQHVRIERC